MIASEFGRTHERHVESFGAGGGGYLFGVGRQQNMVSRGNLPGNVDGVGYQRATGKRFYVLAGNAFAASAGRNYYQWCHSGLMSWKRFISSPSSGYVASRSVICASVSGL